MKRILLCFFTLIFSVTSHAELVSFKNSSGAVLRCDKQNRSEYIPVLRLEHGEVREFIDFPAPYRMRCNTELNEVSPGALTVYTYFEASRTGSYEFLRERVHCNSCKGNYRWATIVVYPNGSSHYTKM